MSIELLKTESVYKVSLDVIKELVAVEIGCSVSNIEINYELTDVSDPDSRFPHYEVSHLSVKVKSA